MRIKELRRKANLTQTELSARIGVSLSTLSYWESGKRNPRNVYLPRIAHELNCSVDELYGESKEELSEATSDKSERPNVAEDIDNTIHDLCACVQQEAKNYDAYSGEKALQEMTIALAEFVKARGAGISPLY